ncbi:DMT family transporter [Minwuia sp.]|uniref:DMT family transporter n=1 Tax=Minwuia sp. TaxID=2493630 RepID=UPI003A9559A7
MIRPAASSVLAIAFWMLVSAIGFAAIMVIIRELADDLPIFVLSFWRNMFAVLLFVPWILRVGISGLKTDRLPMFTLRSLFMVASSIMLFYAAVLIPIGEATAITFTSPLFATVLAVFVLKEKIGWRRGLALATGFAGMLIILRPGVEAISPGALLAIGASVLFAYVVILGKQLSSSESPELVILLLSVINLPLSLIPALFVWESPSGDQWLWLIGLGIAANVNMYGIQRAVSVGEASLTQVFDFVRLPVSALAAWWAFSEVPDKWMWAGAAIIFAAAVYTTRRETQKNART